jgi:subtilisin family serine protease
MKPLLSLLLLFTHILYPQTPPQVQQDLMNFEPGELIVKLKDNVDAGVSYAENGKAVSNFNIGELLGIEDKIESSDVMFHKKGIEASIVNSQKMKAVYMAKGVKNPKDPLTMKNIFVLKTTNQQENILMLIDQIKDNPNVEYAEPNYIYSIDDYEVGDIITAEEAKSMRADVTIDVDDPLYSSQSNITATNIDDVWDQYTTGDGSQVIAILDTGGDYTHPDLEANTWINTAELNGVEGYDDDGNGYVDDIRGWDFINIDNAPLDDNMHGTHVAGIAGAVGNNGIGIAGAAWDVKLMHLKVFQSTGAGSSNNIAVAVEYAYLNGADIINMSWGGFAESFTLKTALETAYSSSFLVAAAGNNGTPIQGCPVPGCRPFYPAAYSFVLGIEDSEGIYDNYDPDGPYITLWTGNLLNYEFKAPGTAITSTVPNGGYATLTGTSMATPLVAGVLALYNEEHPNDSHELTFGNLINTGFSAAPAGKSLNAIDAISVVPIPALQPLYAVITDTINDQNGNGYWQPGETLNLFPLIKNYWGPTEDVRVGLDFWEFEDTSKATIDINEIQIGSISAYATLQDINQSLQLTINESLNNNVEIRLAIRAWSGPDQEYISEPLEVIINVVNSVVFTDYITEDITLTNDKEWIFANSMVVYNGATVTIEAGTTVKMQGQSKIVICDTCKIFSNGTSENPVTITSETGYWYGIELEGPYYNQGFESFNSHEEIANSSLYERGIFNFTNFSNFGATWSSYGTFFDGLMQFHNCNFSNFNMGYNGADRFSNSGLFIQCNISEGTLSNYNNFFLTSNHGIFHRTNFNNVDVYMYVDEQTGGGFPIPLNSSSLNYSPPFYNTWSETHWFSNIQMQSNTSSSLVTNGIIGTSNPASGSGIWDITNQYWFGTSTTDFLSTKFYDYSNNNFFIGLIDYSNARLTPFENNHGVVSKVLVNGKDAQDEYALMDPLGVGIHEFKVYFNREMDTSVDPQISYGVTIPYNQKVITEEGAWSADGKIYTVTHDVNIGAADGINRIRVQDAQDLDYFKIPIEDSRFNMLVQSAGSASTGWYATPGLGKIALTWEAPSSDALDDVLGYNMYRYQVDGDGNEGDPVQLNESLIVEDTDDTTTGVYFTDYDVTEGETYFYKYNILRTSFETTDYSNTISSSPLTSTLGDSNGDFSVDVLDLVHDVDYILGNNPEPFIFVAGDVNADQTINVLDIVGTVDIILSDDSDTTSNSQNINFYPSLPIGYATFSWEGNDLYVESDHNIGGIQLAFDQDFEYVLSEMPGIERLDYQQEDQKILMLYSFNNTTIASNRTKLLTRINQAQEINIDLAVVGTTSGSKLTPVFDGSDLDDIDAPLQSSQLEFLSMIPNPSDGVVTLTYYLPEQMDGVVAKVYDMLGRLVWIQPLQSSEGQSQTQMQLDKLQAGNYIVLISANKQGGLKHLSHKILIIK